MNIRIEIGKYLVQNLFYPAILGSFLFTLIQSIALKIRNPQTENFLSNESNIMYLKFILSIALIAFFCCDYLYCYLTEVYKPKYFLIDFLAINLLIISFFSLNVDSSAIPSGTCVVLPFIIFLVFFTIWDYWLVKSITGEGPFQKRRKSFFRKLFIGQFILSIILGGFYIKYLLDDKLTFLLSVYAISLFLATFFISAISIKKPK